MWMESLCRSANPERVMDVCERMKPMERVACNFGELLHFQSKRNGKAIFRKIKSQSTSCRFIHTRSHFPNTKLLVELSLTLAKFVTEHAEVWRIKMPNNWRKIPNDFSHLTLYKLYVQTARSTRVQARIIWSLNESRTSRWKGMYVICSLIKLMI